MKELKIATTTFIVDARCQHGKYNFTPDDLVERDYTTS